MEKTLLGKSLGLTLLLAACPLFPVSHDTVKAGSSITWNGEKTALLGRRQGLQEGRPFPAVILTTLQMTPQALKPDGKVRLISLLPSLDTPVCHAQTRQIGQTSALNEKIERVTISMDLPYAQRRFAKANKLKNIIFLSDYLTGNFGRKAGLRIERNGLLARAIVVTDGQGIIRYFQIVPEITDMPDLERAYKVANGLVTDEIKKRRD